jgi:hypothetical protein
VPTSTSLKLTTTGMPSWCTTRPLQSSRTLDLKPQCKTKSAAPTSKN